MLDKISIIMPVRNGIPFLTECINSIINQKYINWELILVNDHSTDDTQKIIDKYTKLDNRIISAITNGKGIIDALNTGYALSNGIFITRMDADDIMPINKLDILHGLIANETSSAVATGYIEYFSDDGVKDGYRSYEAWLNQLCDDNNHFQCIYKECVIASPAWMMKRDHFESIGGFKSEKYPEDYDLCFRMYKHKVKVISTTNKVHQWRDHGSRTSRNDKNYADNSFLDLKLDYFKTIETPKHKRFILLGAGKKGKTTAKFLLENNIKFTWATNNPKKIGIDIYGVILSDYNIISYDIEQTAILITVANKEEQAEIKDRLSLIDPTRVYYLC